MSDPAQLPLWAQIGGAVATAIVGVAVAIKGYLPKKPPTDTHSGRDAVVLSAAIADSATIRDLAGAIRDLKAELIRGREGNDHQTLTIKRGLEALLEEAEGIHKAIKQLGERTIL